MGARRRPQEQQVLGCGESQDLPGRLEAGPGRAACRTREARYLGVSVAAGEDQHGDTGPVQGLWAWWALSISKRARF